ncbi:MAG TPA: nuclear transport factor 2 family protein [Planctomycetota bacterium]|nr:nuclear transport factor 2 family protein [Planctomycetota bacterium]
MSTPTPLPSLTPAAADELARAWISAWNAHDLDRILSHYSDDVEFTSPFVAQILGSSTAGVVRGKGKLRDYFRAGLEAYPDLLFELRDVLAGVGSIVIVYKSVRDLIAAEVLELDQEGRILRARAHYRPG